jgi:serine/threonine protein kinase
VSDSEDSRYIVVLILAAVVILIVLTWSCWRHRKHLKENLVAKLESQSQAFKELETQIDARLETRKSYFKTEKHCYRMKKLFTDAHGRSMGNCSIQGVRVVRRTEEGAIKELRGTEALEGLKHDANANLKKAEQMIKDVKEAQMIKDVKDALKSHSIELKNLVKARKIAETQAKEIQTEEEDDGEAVVLRFMRQEEAYKAELLAREAGDSSFAAEISDHCTMNPKPGDLVVPGEAQPVAVESYVVVQKEYGRHLKAFLEQTGTDDLSKNAEFLHEIASHLHAMEKAHVVHGQCALRSFMTTGEDKKGERVKLGDFAACVSHADKASVGARYTTSTAPPELMRRLLEFRAMRKKEDEETTIADAGTSTPPPRSSTPPPRSSTPPPRRTSTPPPVQASTEVAPRLENIRKDMEWDEWLRDGEPLSENPVTYDMWSFGVLVYTLSTPGLTHFFHEYKGDLVDSKDVQTLAYNWAREKFTLVDRIGRENVKARDLALWCLQERPERRPQSFADVLQHPLLSGSWGHSLHYEKTDYVQRVIDLHDAVEKGEVEKAQTILERGGVHVDATLHHTQTGVTPLHRAARSGDMKMLRLLLAEGADKEAKTDLGGGRRALHWACRFDRAEAVKELLRHGCDVTAVTSRRGRTGWDIALAYGSKAVVELFERLATGATGATVEIREKLKREKANRERRPKVARDTYRDDIEIDPARLDFWSVVPFDTWKEVEEGGFGVVFDAQAAPDIEVAGRRFRRVAVKVPKEVGVEALKSEVEALAYLDHPNIVQILGMSEADLEGTVVGSRGRKWMMIMEFCETDLQKMISGKDKKLPQKMINSKDDESPGVELKLTKKLMVKLMCEMIEGLSYCHDNGICHLDFKPENCLLRATGNPEAPWTAKIADFGAIAVDKHYADPGSRWIGTYLYMAPEATGLNAENDNEKGRVLFKPLKTGAEVEEDEEEEEDPPSVFGASDWFSFGIVIWEMVTRSAPVQGMGEAFQGDLIEKVWVAADGKEDRSMVYRPGDRSQEQGGGAGQWREDYRAVAKAYYRGNRPQIPDSCPPLLAKLMIACWQDKQEDRPTAETMKQLVDVASDKWLEPPPSLPTYDEFLSTSKAGLTRDDLAEYLSDGAELVELIQMDEQDLKDDILHEVCADNPAARDEFYAAVLKLKDFGKRDDSSTANRPDACQVLKEACTASRKACRKSLAETVREQLNLRQMQLLQEEEEGEAAAAAATQPEPELEPEPEPEPELDLTFHEQPAPNQLKRYNSASSVPSPSVS